MVCKSLYTCRTEFDVTGLSLLGRVEGAVVSLRTHLGDPHLICVKGEGWRGRIGQSIKPVNIVRIKDQGKWTAVNCGNVVIEEAVMHVRQKISEGKNMAEPLLMSPGMYMAFFVGFCVLANRLMARAQQRWPRRESYKVMRCEGAS